MFGTLIESRPHRSPGARATAGSLVAHCAVVVAVIAGTWRGLAPAAPDPVRDYTMLFAAPRHDDRAGPAPLRLDLAGPVRPAPDLPLLPDVPPPLGGMPPDFPSSWGRLPVSPHHWPDGWQQGDDPVPAALAEELPEMLVAGTPRYPEQLRMAGIGGRVVVEAVIDTLGRPEPGSLRVIESAHVGFHDAAITYVGGALFRPGRVLGRAVRVRVRLPIEFRLTR